MTTATATLTQFLRARIAEDEATARVANDWNFTAEARVLAECEAKRRIVESAEFVRDTPSIHDDARTFMSNVLRRLAAVYAEHPDYREEWRP